MKIKKYKLKRYILIIFIFACPFLSCNKRPKGILSENEMVSLMVDMQIADAYYEMTAHGGSSYNSNKNDFGKSVLIKHGVTQEEVDSTLKWYGRNLDEYAALFAKVDKELQKQKEIIEKENQLITDENDLDNLWPYSKNGILLPTSTTQGWIFDLNGNDVGKGDRLLFSMHFSIPQSVKSVLGVEYNDGSGDAITNLGTNRPKVELTLQTDTGKQVSRIYGSIILNEKVKQPLLTDSIILTKLPIDSLEYKKIRNQKKYHALQNKRVISKDTLNHKNSVSKDTIENKIVISKDTIENKNHISKSTKKTKVVS